MTHLVLTGDARRLPLPDESVHCCICSPPYFGLRDYGTATWEGGDPKCGHIAPPRRGSGTYSETSTLGPKQDGLGPDNAAWRVTEQQYRDLCGKCGARRVDRQIGLEATPDDFCKAMVAVFREVKRVLRDDGCLWLNLGDSYGSGNSGQTCRDSSGGVGGGRVRNTHDQPSSKANCGKAPIVGMHKQLLGIPWCVAFALQADGWYLRDAIIWSKADVDDDDVLEGSAMPGSQRDRCTSAYEMVFQLAKRPRYYFDAEAIKSKSGAMPRNVWRINPSPWKGAHFATFPPALVERCVKAGTSERGCCPCGAPWERVVDAVASSEGRKNWAGCEHSKNGASRNGGFYDAKSTTLGWRQSCSCPAHAPIPCTVLDNFAGSGTTGVVATGLGRSFVGLDLSADYCRMAVRRISRPHASHRTARRDEPMPLFPVADAPP